MGSMTYQLTATSIPFLRKLPQFGSTVSRRPGQKFLVFRGEYLMTRSTFFSATDTLSGWLFTKRELPEVLKAIRRYDKRLQSVPSQITVLRIDEAMTAKVNQLKIA